MAESFAIFFVVVVAIVVLGGFLWFFEKFEDAIARGIFILFGLGLIGGGVFLLLKIGGPIGAIGIFIALWGGVLCYAMVHDIKR